MGSYPKEKEKKIWKKNHDEEIYRYASGKYHTKSQVYSTSTDYEINVVINALEGFKLFLINKNEITIWTDCETIVAYGSQQINSDKKPHKRWLLFQEYVYHNGIKINFEHIKGVKNVVVDILSRFVGIQPDEAL